MGCPAQVRTLAGEDGAAGCRPEELDLVYCGLITSLFVG